MGNSCSPGCRLWCLLSPVMSLMASFVLSVFPRDVLDDMWDLIESVSEASPSYSCVARRNLTFQS